MRQLPLKKQTNKQKKRKGREGGKEEKEDEAGKLAQSDKRE